ncbi:MAG: DUF4340 domain-containing protein [Clostridiales bacterium]|nr:DUF4340 domain-containing protein [Clostridiales bacterium]
MRMYKAVIISVVVLAVGIAGFFIVREIVERNTPAKIYELNTVITSLRSDDITELTIYNNGIMMPMLLRSETVYDNDGNKKIIEAWYLANEENTKLSQSIVDGIVIASSNLVAAEVIESEVEDLSQYGLDGSYYVEGKTEKGIAYKIILGSILYNREGYYAMLEGDTTVYSVSVYSANQLYASRAELLDLNIFKGSLNEVQSFSLNKDGDLKFTVESDLNTEIVWIITHPVLSKADISNADEMISNLLALSREEYVDVNPEDLSVYGLLEPDYSVSIIINDMEYTMHIGREDIISNTFYAKMNEEDEVFTIDASTMTFLDNEAIDMVYLIPYIPRLTNVKSVDINIGNLDNLLLEIEFDPEINMMDYTFNGTPINMVLGVQTWGSFFFQQMLYMPVIDLEPDWEISGEPYGYLTFTYTDEVYETIEYYPRDAESVYYVRNGFYDGLVVDKTNIIEGMGFAGLVDLVLTGEILEMLEDTIDNQGE